MTGADWGDFLSDVYAAHPQGVPIPELKPTLENTAPYMNGSNVTRVSGWKVLGVIGLIVVIYHGMQR